MPIQVYDTIMRHYAWTPHSLHQLPTIEISNFDSIAWNKSYKFWDICIEFPSFFIFNNISAKMYIWWTQIYDKLLQCTWKTLMPHMTNMPYLISKYLLWFTYIWDETNSIQVIT